MICTVVRFVYLQEQKRSKIDKHTNNLYGVRATGVAVSGPKNSIHGHVDLWAGISSTHYQSLVFITN